MALAEKPRAEVKSPIQSIDRAVSLLFHLADGGGQGLELRQLVSLTGLKTSTVHSLLSSLLVHGLAEQVPGDRKYRLGAASLELHRRYLAHSDLASLAAEPARELWRRTAETVFVSVRRGWRRVDLIRLLGSQRLSVNVLDYRDGHAEPDESFGWHSTAVGKVLLAGMDRPAAEELLLSRELPRMTSSTRTSFAEVMEELERIREVGFAVNHEEAHVGVCGIAAPLIDATGLPVAALCVAYPASRHSDEYVARLCDELLRSASELSAVFGANPAPKSTSHPHIR